MTTLLQCGIDDAAELNYQARAGTAWLAVDYCSRGPWPDQDVPYVLQDANIG